MRFVFLFFCFTSFTFLAQKDQYQNYDLHPPLKIPLVLAANFGELRSNHFHTGLDFKTNRREGYTIYSVEDGYVSRIKVSPWGYGHVVYIDHYNGLTSVYAHCSGFVGAIDSLVKSEQRKNEGFEFECYPEKESVKVKRGQPIALSGNTGGSTAPHLHFEIRDTKTENAINPLLFGWDIQDHRKPTIRGMKVYGLTVEGYRIPGVSRTLPVYGGNGSYRISNNKLTLPSNYSSAEGGVGFAFDAIDKLDGADNVCGIFKAYLLVDGDTVFTQNMTEISFYSNRYINCHKDYEEFHQRRKHFHKAFKTVHNPLPIYPSAKNNGIISILPGEQKMIEYICEDTEGNTASVNFQLELLSGEMNPKSRWFEPTHNYLFPDSAFMEMGDDYLVLFPPGLLYEPTPLVFGYQNGITFGSPSVPLQEFYKVMLKIEDQKLPNEKYIISRTNQYGRKYAERSEVEDGWITSWVRSFGTFKVDIDTIPPTIVRKNFVPNANVRGKTLRWSIQDDLSGVAEYNIFIDDEWHLLSYEPKNGIGYYFEVPSHVQGRRTVKIRAEDYCGNTTIETYELLF